MKTIASSILPVLFLLFHSFTALAKETNEKSNQTKETGKLKACTTATPTSFQSNIFQNAAGRVSVIVMKTDPEPVTIQVSDSQNLVLFSKVIKEDSVKQNLYMNELDPGTYQVTLSKNGECFSKTVSVK